VVFKLGVAKGFHKLGRGLGYWFPKAPTPCDFVGWLSDGRVVAFDAKMRRVRSERDWRWRYSDAPAHQVAALQLAEEAGGWGFFLVAILGGNLEEARVVRASLLAPRRSVDLRECPRIEWRLSAPQWDWLSALNELLGKEAGHGSTA